mgnify:CR=1 FL=1
MMFVVYGVIIFLASGIGAFLGGGSGVIIKPLLTLLVDDTTDLLRVRFCHELQFHRKALARQDEGGL